MRIEPREKLDRRLLVFPYDGSTLRPQSEMFLGITSQYRLRRVKSGDKVADESWAGPVKAQRDELTRGGDPTQQSVLGAHTAPLRRVHSHLFGKTSMSAVLSLRWERVSLGLPSSVLWSILDQKKLCRHASY